MGSSSGSGCHSGGIWGGAEFLCRVEVACGVSGELGIGRLGCCAFVFSLSCGICVCGVMFEWGGGLQGGDVGLAWVPGFGVECLGGRFFAFFVFFGWRFPLRRVGSWQTFQMFRFCMYE